MRSLPLFPSSAPRAPSSGVGGASRLARYSLRLSLLEACNLRCAYCLPGSVTSPVAQAQWLRAADYARLLPLFRARGVAKIRLTGGEPLLRDDVADIVAVCREHAGGADVALTTNGTRLSERLPALVQAGLRRVTVHTDTLREERYAALMGKGELAPVLEAVSAAKAALDDVKVNVVVQRGHNDDEISAFLDWSRQTGVEVRFIELMNTGSAVDYTTAVFMAGKDIVAVAREARGVEPIPRRHESDPAALYRTTDGVVFGVIASDTEPFCGACDRLRLTADGRLRGCLYQSGGVPLGTALRSGASDATLQALLDAGLDDKRSHHPTQAAARPAFSMADIGG